MASGTADERTCEELQEEERSFQERSRKRCLNTAGRKNEDAEQEAEEAEQETQSPRERLPEEGRKVPAGKRPENVPLKKAKIPGFRRTRHQAHTEREREVQKTRDKVLAVASQLGCSDKDAKELLRERAKSARSETKEAKEHGTGKVKTRRGAQSRSQNRSSTSSKARLEEEECGCRGRNRSSRRGPVRRNLAATAQHGQNELNRSIESGASEAKEKEKSEKRRRNRKEEPENVKEVKATVQEKEKNRVKVPSIHIPEKKNVQKIIRDPRLDQATKSCLVLGPRTDADIADTRKIGSASGTSEENDGPEDSETGSHESRSRSESKSSQHQTSLAMGTLGLREHHQTSLAVEHARSVSSSVGELAPGDGHETEGVRATTTAAEVYAEPTTWVIEDVREDTGPRVPVGGRRGPRRSQGRDKHVSREATSTAAKIGISLEKSHVPLKLCTLVFLRGGYVVD